jgi:16S rRNA (cytidine1402-2'-O)-methyltransferase
VVLELTFIKVNKQTRTEQIAEIFAQIPKDSNVGIISEAGVPCVADPGSLVVDFAHKKKWHIFPIPGASSIILALMGSGMNGQKFTFNGYLPIKLPEAKKAIHQIQAEAEKGFTQIFMETPFRNNKLFEWLLTHCKKDLRLCIACNLTAPDQFVRTRKVSEWKTTDIDLHKKPTIFVLGV